MKTLREINSRIELLNDTKQELEFNIFRFNKEEDATSINKLNKINQDIKNAKIIKFELIIKNNKTLNQDEKNIQINKYIEALNSLFI